MLDKINELLYEEGYVDRFDGEIKRIIRTHKSPEFIRRIEKLLDKKNKTSSLKHHLEFYEFCAQKVGDQVLIDILSSNYSQITKFYLKQIAERINPDDKVTDVGCGAGLISSISARLHPDAYFVGLDISEGLLMRARERAERWNIKNLKFTNAGMDHLYQQLSQRTPESLPFDYLICLDTLNESILEEDRKGSSRYEKIIRNRLKQFEKVLGNSGKASIGMSCYFSKRDSYDLMKDFYERLLGSVFSLENMLSKEIRTKDGIIYTAYLFNVKVKS